MDTSRFSETAGAGAAPSPPGAEADPAGGVGGWALFTRTRAKGTAAAWAALGRALAEAERPRGAIHAYRRAARRDPVDFPSRHALARLLHDQDRPAEARAVERELLVINPYDTAALTRLGASLAQETAAAARHEAEGCLRDADRLGADPAVARLALCRLLMDQEREAEVVALNEAAEAPLLLLQRARAQIALGAFDGAEAALTTVLAQEPGNGPAWQQLAALRRHARAPAVIPEAATDDPLALAEAYAECAEGRDREQLAFALGNMREQAGDYGGAWAAYTDANARVRARLPSDIDAVEAHDARIRASLGAETLNRLARGAVTTPRPPIAWPTTTIRQRPPPWLRTARGKWQTAFAFTAGNFYEAKVDYATAY